MEKLGTIKLPSGLPLAYVETYREIIKQWKQDELKALKIKSEKQYRAITLRYGIGDDTFKTLDEVGNIMNHATRESVRQLEERALKFLGITST